MDQVGVDSLNASEVELFEVFAVDFLVGLVLGLKED
jgi:hypothetical protein